MDGSLAKTINREVGRYFEQIGPMKAHYTRSLELQHPDISLLRDFVGFGFRAQPGDEEAHEHGVVLAEQLLNEGSTGGSRVSGCGFKGFGKMLRHCLVLNFLDGLGWEFGNDPTIIFN